MTVTTTTNKEKLLIKSNQREYTFNIKVYPSANNLHPYLSVRIQKSEFDVQLQVEGIDYQVVLFQELNKDGGKIIFPENKWLEKDSTLIIERIFPLKQEIAFLNNQEFLPRNIEDGLDKSRMIDQQLQSQIDDVSERLLPIDDLKRLVNDADKSAIEAKIHRDTAGGFAAKAGDHAKDSEKSAQESKSSAEKANEYAKDSKKSAQESKSSAEKANKYAQDSKKSAEESKGSVKLADEHAQNSEKSAQESKSSAKLANKYAKDSEKSAQESKSSAEQADNSAIEAKVYRDSAAGSAAVAGDYAENSKKSAQESENSAQESSETEERIKRIADNLNIPDPAKGGPGQGIIVNEDGKYEFTDLFTYYVYIMEKYKNDVFPRLGNKYTFSFFDMLQENLFAEKDFVFWQQKITNAEKDERHYPHCNDKGEQFFSFYRLFWSEFWSFKIDNSLRLVNDISMSTPNALQFYINSSGELIKQSSKIWKTIPLYDFTLQKLFLTFDRSVSLSSTFTLSIYELNDKDQYTLLDSISSDAEDIVVKKAEILKYNKLQRHKIILKQPIQFKKGKVYGFKYSMTVSYHPAVGERYKLIVNPIAIDYPQVSSAYYAQVSAIEYKNLYYDIENYQYSESANFPKRTFSMYDYVFNWNKSDTSFTTTDTFNKPFDIYIDYVTISRLTMGKVILKLFHKDSKNKNITTEISLYPALTYPYTVIRKIFKQLSKIEYTFKDMYHMENIAGLSFNDFKKSLFGYEGFTIIDGSKSDIVTTPDVELFNITYNSIYSDIRPITFKTVPLSIGKGARVITFELVIITTNIDKLDFQFLVFDKEEKPLSQLKVIKYLTDRKVIYGIRFQNTSKENDVIAMQFIQNDKRKYVIESLSMFTVA